MTQKWNKTEDKLQPFDVKSVKAKQTILVACLNTDFVCVISKASLLQIYTMTKRKPSWGVTLSAETQLVELPESCR